MDVAQKLEDDRDNSAHTPVHFSYSSNPTLADVIIAAENKSALGPRVTALILARVFGNSPDFWLNVQRRIDLWEAMHSARDRKRIERARPLTSAA